MRDNRSYLAGHHPKALHLSEQSLRPHLKHTARHIPIIIYCYHGHSSQDMAKLFSDFGFTNCYSIDGGYEAWFQTVCIPKIPLSEALCEWLNEHGFNPENLDQRGENNNTALLVAARQGNVAIAMELINAGASLNLVNKDGNNALWMASFSDSLPLISALIEAGIDIDHQNDNGATALIYAASAGKSEIVDALITQGADANRVTLDDFNALDVAASRDVFRLLRPLYRASQPITA